MKTKVLGVEFTDLNIEGASKVLEGVLGAQRDLPYHVITANPEIVMQINRDATFKTIEEAAGMVTPDGIGILYGSRILGQRIYNKVTGVDLLVNLLDLCEKKGHRVFFLGADEATSQKMLAYVKKNYPALKIAGRHTGYFDVKDDGDLVAAINQGQTDMLVMAMGSPRAHLWFHSRREALKIKATIDVGGSFDALTGTVKRAPKWIQKLNVEWLYRRLQNRERAKRQKDLYRFVGEVFKERFRRQKKY